MNTAENWRQIIAADLAAAAGALSPLGITCTRPRPKWSMANGCRSSKPCGSAIARHSG
jgi:hypothetical protein